MSAAAGKKARRRGKVGSDQLSHSALADPSDTVALITPHLKEVDLWPSPGAYKTVPDSVIGSGSLTGADRPADGTAEREGVVVQPAVPDKSVFLREARTVRALQHLENAVCDMR